jgi:hypothetical protein
LTYKQLKTKKNNMKKVLAIFAIAALVACGGATTEVVTDSTAVQTDSTAVVVDSVKTDSVEVK